MANPALWGFGLAAVGLIAAGVWLKLDEGRPVSLPVAAPTPAPTEALPPPSDRPGPAQPVPALAKPEPEPQRTDDQGQATEPTGAPQPARATGTGGTLPRLVATIRGWGQVATSGIDPAPP